MLENNVTIVNVVDIISFIFCPQKMKAMTIKVIFLVSLISAFLLHKVLASLC